LVDFFDLREGAGKKSERPTVKTVRSSVLFTIPASIAELASLKDATALHIKAGFDRDRHRQVGLDHDPLVVLLTANPKARWKCSNRTNLSVYVPEIYPSGDFADPTSLDFTVDSKGLCLALPDNWQLLDETALLKDIPLQDTKPAKGKTDSRRANGQAEKPNIS
jgi:hypothetical protein